MKRKSALLFGGQKGAKQTVAIISLRYGNGYPGGALRLDSAWMSGVQTFCFFCKVSFEDVPNSVTLRLAVCQNQALAFVEALKNSMLFPVSLKFYCAQPL